MYRIIKDGADIGLTESPNYIKKAENGCYVLCPEPDASGIVYSGTVYHLLGRDDLDECETVLMEEMNGGDYVFANRKSADDADAMNVDHEYRLTMLELGLTE